MASSTVSDTSFALQSSIQKFKQDLEAFAKRTVADVEQTKSLCKNSLAQKKEMKKKLMIKKASLKHELIEKNQAFRTVNSRVTELMNQKTSLESEIRREMPQALGEVRSEQNKSTQHLQTLETEAAAEKMVSEAKTLRSICEMYSQRLGLDLIKLPEGRVQFEFTQVDSKRPERVFLFQIKLDENKRYVVPNCEPKLPNLDDMVQLLNARDARGAKGLFGWFVQAMRREFCKIVATAPESDDAANESVDEISHIYG